MRAFAGFGRRTDLSVLVDRDESVLAAGGFVPAPGVTITEAESTSRRNRHARDWSSVTIASVWCEP